MDKLNIKDRSSQDYEAGHNRCAYDRNLGAVPAGDIKKEIKKCFELSF